MKGIGGWNVGVRRGLGAEVRKGDDIEAADQISVMDRIHFFIESY